MSERELCGRYVATDAVEHELVCFKQLLEGNLL